MTQATIDGSAGRLPTERELGARLGVSRGALRERLATLQAMGMVRRRQGSGTYIEAPDPAFAMLYFDLAVRFGQISTDELERAREMLEMAVVRSAAERATDQDVRGLRAQIDEMYAASSADDVERGDNADYEFHRQIYRIADNPVLDLLTDGLSSALRGLLHDRRRSAWQAEDLEAGKTPRRRETDAVHEGIADAVAAHDPDAAVLAVRRHYEVWRGITGATSD
ncbi:MULTISPECIES: FadR/GntR family transcriptional regulator [Streptomyces]|uniref:FadR/GntR family transcriptional regulator n=2 Tax=Streptomyces TaxID=1883 RepID=A0ABV9JC71_9ACTN